MVEENKKRCINCIWRQSQPNDQGIVYCKFLDLGVYQNSVACSHFEYYEPF